MAIKNLLAQLVAISAAVSAQPLEKKAGIPVPGLPINPVCAAIQGVVPAFPTQATAVPSFCTSYFGITTTTITARSTTTVLATTTSYTYATATITPTVTSYVSTQTCFQNTATANPANKVKRAQSPQSSVASVLVSSACSCYGVNFSPSTTTTVPITATSYVATNTVYTSTSTSTAPAQTTTATLTFYVPSNGTYIASDGSSFNDYVGYDFYGNDLYSDYCAPRSGQTSYFNSPVGSFPCNNFNDCQSVCSSYNAANRAQGSQYQTCKGVSYNTGATFCYLKYAVPGNGAPNCQPDPNSSVDSAIEQVQAS